MSAHTVAMRLSEDEAVQAAIEKLLDSHGLTDRECEGVLVLVDAFLEGVGAQGGAIDSAVILEAGARAVDTICSRRDRSRVEKETPKYVPDARASGNPWDAIQSAPDYLAATEVDADFLVSNLLARGTLTMFMSPRGIGKTHVAHALAVRLASEGKRVLVVDRDNSRRELRRRLRSVGAAGMRTLKVIGRDDAPSLTQSAAWARFPISEYDLVLLDSFDASTEGVGEQDSAKPSLALAPLLDIAHTASGPAVLVLANTIKSGSHGRGSGIVEDRADIVYEVRDATDLRPSGTKDWWLELPPADRGSWADRATRRKRRDRYRLAFVPSKFRIGEEPDPFVIEVRLDETPWTCEVVTQEIVAAGVESREEAEREKAARLDRARTALVVEVARLAAARNPITRGAGAEEFLASHDLRRSEARSMIADGMGKLWRAEGSGHRGDPVVLVPLEGTQCSDGGENTKREDNPRQYSISENPILADRMDTGRRESEAQSAAPGLDNSDSRFSPKIGDGAGVPNDSTPASETCPDCGGRLLRWTFGTACTVCHRRVAGGSP